MQPHSSRALAAVEGLAVPGSTSASAPLSCSRSWERRGPRSSGWTSASPWLTRCRGSAGTTPCRATSTRALFAPWEALGIKVREIVSQASRRPATSSTSATGCCPDTDPDVVTRVTELVRDHRAVAPRPPTDHRPGVGAGHRLPLATVLTATGSPCPRFLTAPSPPGSHPASLHLGLSHRLGQSAVSGRSVAPGRPSCCSASPARRAGPDDAPRLRRGCCPLDLSSRPAVVDSGPVVGCEEALGMQPPPQVQPPPSPWRLIGSASWRLRRARPSRSRGLAAPAGRGRRAPKPWINDESRSHGSDRGAVPGEPGAAPRGLAASTGTSASGSPSSWPW